MAQMDNRDEFQVTEDAIRSGGDSAEKATMAETAVVLKHMVQVLDSTVVGAPRKKKVDLAERCEAVIEKLQNPEAWSLGDRSPTDLLAMVTMCKETQTIVVGAAVHETDTPKMELTLVQAESWMRARDEGFDDGDDDETMTSGTIHDLTNHWGPLHQSDTPVIGNKYRTAVGSQVDVREHSGTETSVLGTLAEGEEIFVADREIIVQNGVGTTFVQFYNASLKEDAIEGWIAFNGVNLERYIVNKKLDSLLEETPGFPDFSFQLLWSTLIKIGFPINDIAGTNPMFPRDPLLPRDQRGKAKAMVADVMRRYGRNIGAITDWLHNLDADQYANSFTEHGIESLEDMEDMVIITKDLELFGVRDFQMRKKMMRALGK